MSEAPRVFCRKDKKKVPVWYCLGSFVQKREPCPYLDKAFVDMRRDAAEVECSFKSPLQALKEANKRNKGGS